MDTEHDDLEELLEVGLGVLFHPQPRENKKLFYKTTVRGWLRGDHILLGRPRVGGGPVLILKEGQLCIVRYLKDGYACAFFSEVMGWESRQGDPAMRLRWPQQFQCVCLRKHERVDVRIPCRVTGLGKAETTGELHDLSIEGCAIRAPAGTSGTDLGVPVCLAFTLPNGTIIEKLAAQVRSSRRGAEYLLLGCCFDSDQVHERHEIASYISACRQSQRVADGQVLGRTILVVDRDSAVSPRVSKALGLQEGEVVSAGNAVDGFYLVRAMHPNALVMRADWPGLSTCGVCKLIANCPGLESLPVFLYGGEGKDLEKRSECPAGVRCFPLSDGVLDKVIEEVSVWMRGNQAPPKGAPSPD